MSGHWCRINSTHFDQPEKSLQPDLSTWAKTGANCLVAHANPPGFPRNFDIIALTEISNDRDCATRFGDLHTSFEGLLSTKRLDCRIHTFSAGDSQDLFDGVDLLKINNEISSIIFGQLPSLGYRIT